MVNNINIQHFNALHNVTCAQIIELRSNGRRYGSWAYTWIWWPRFASLLCDFFRCWKKTDRWMDEQYHSIISPSMEGCTAFFQLTICYIINSRKTISVRASVWNICQRHSHKIRVSFWSSRITMALLIGCCYCRPMSTAMPLQLSSGFWLRVQLNCVRPTLLTLLPKRESRPYSVCRSDELRWSFWMKSCSLQRTVCAGAPSHWTIR